MAKIYSIVSNDQFTIVTHCLQDHTNLLEAGQAKEQVIRSTKSSSERVRCTRDGSTVQRSAYDVVVL